MDKRGPFNVDVRAIPQGVRVIVTGVVDEKAALPSFDSLGKVIEVDLKNVHYLNSYGVRIWANWAASHRGAKEIILENVPAVVVKQINVFQGFLGANAQVKSLFAPYVHPKTMEDRQVLLIHGIHFSKGGINLPTEVAADGTLLEPDFFVDQFFKFLKS